MELSPEVIKSIFRYLELKRMTVFSISLVLILFYTPSNLVTAINSRTPAVFPEWIDLFLLVSIAGSLLITLLFVIAFRLIKSFASKVIDCIVRKKLIGKINNLRKDEKSILYRLNFGYPIYEDEEPMARIPIKRLLNMKLISHSGVVGCYVINPLIQDYISKLIDESHESHH